MGTAHALTAAQAASYREDGFVGPFDLMGRDEALAIGERLLARRRRLVDRLLRGDQDQNRHVDVPDLFRLCVRSEVLDRIEDLLGPELTLWRTRVHAKAPDGIAYPFHQDGAYWRLRDRRTSPPRDVPSLGLSAWVALSDTDLGNGCVEIVPGSHHELVPHAPDLWPFGVAAAGPDVAALPAVPMVMRAGQFFLFHNLVLHRSGLNTSTQVRVGFVARFTVGGVSVDEASTSLWSRAARVVVRGKHRDRRVARAAPA